MGAVHSTQTYSGAMLHCCQGTRGRMPYAMGPPGRHRTRTPAQWHSMQPVTYCMLTTVGLVGSSIQTANPLGSGLASIAKSALSSSIQWLTIPSARSYLAVLRTTELPFNPAREI